MTTGGQTRMEETISLKEIYDILKKRIISIILITILAAIIAAVVSSLILTPIYQSSSQFIVNQGNNNQDQDFQIDSSTIRTNVELINTYNVIITSRAILQEVIEELNLPYSPGELAKNINVTSEQNSQVVNVEVKDPNPQTATAIANSVVTTFQERIPDILNVDNVKILTEAYTAENPKPIEPNTKLNIAIATVLGLMISVGIAFLREYFNTTITTEEELEQHTEGLPILAIITTIKQEDVRQKHQPYKQNTMQR